MAALATRVIYFAQTNGADVDSEIVWSWPPDAEAKLRETGRAATVTNKPGHRGDHV